MRAIGRGGMATVYLAIQESFEREVALKIMSPQLAEEQDFSERFLREARIVSKLVHPNIVTVHDVGIENGHHYLSMQYIDGKDLKQRLPELSAAQIFRALGEVAMALNYAGDKGYVHRDVKPDNIMLDSSDGRAILMDFGIARASRPDNSMTRTGTALGTPHYMSPEQARGAEVDGRSDLYSLGVLFYYLLVGQVPYEADSPVAVGIKHLTEPVPTLPAPLACYQPLINKLMAKKPEQRYQTGREVAEALQQVPQEPLAQWHSRKDFEYRSDGSDTPVRNTVTEDFGTVIGDAATAVVPATRRSAPARKPPAAVKKPTDKTPAPRDSLHIPREDLEGRTTERQSRLVKPVLVLFLVLALGALAGYVLYPDQFLAQVERAQQWLEQQKGGQSVAVTPPPGAVDDRATSPGDMRADSGDQEADGAAMVPAGGADATTAADAAGVTTADGEANPVDDSLAPIWLQIEELNSIIDQQPERRGELLGLYSDVLAIDANNFRAIEAIDTQRQNAVAEVQQQIAGGELDAARARIINLQEWFPEIEQDEAFQALTADLRRAEDIQQLLAAAEGFLQEDKLLKPAEGNAVGSYRAVLAIDETNAAAQAGLQAVADRYRQLAEGKQKAGAYASAITLATSGLSVMPADTNLTQLKSTLQAQLKKQQRVESLIGEAQTYTSRNILFARDASAAQRLLAALKLDPGNKSARQGLQKALTSRYAEVEALLAERKFDAATGAVEEALALVPKDERLLGLLLEIESSRPAIDTLLLSGTAIQSMYRDPQKTITADRVLHIAFHYKNLANANTVFQALLFDGSRSLQIAAVPVVVSGSEGDTQFRIDRPVEGFTEGGYHIDILLAGQRIFTRAFTIAK